MANLGYTMTADVKVIRRKHLVTFRVGMTVSDLIKSLGYVPEDALVDEVIEELDDGVCSIEFHEEVLEAPTK